MERCRHNGGVTYEIWGYYPSKSLKEVQKYLSKSQLEKLSKFFKTLEFDPLPVERYDVKPVKGKRSEIGKGKLYRFRIEIIGYSTPFFGTRKQLS